MRKKFDVSVYLAFIAVPFLVLLCWIWFILGIWGILVVHNAFPIAFTAANSFSFFPLIIYGLWKERREYSPWQMLPLLFLVTAYTYHWIPCLASALVKIVTRKPVWEKTPRFNNSGRRLGRGPRK